MIHAATKYSSVRGASAKAPPQRIAPAAAEARPGFLSGPGRAAFEIVTRKAKQMQPQDFVAWWNRELRQGGELYEYCQREKAQTQDRYREVARRVHGRQGFKQNNKSEFRRVADIPVRDYFRWTAQDPDFFNDDRNLKSLKRDNPDACVYI